jgi:hypothetical protein
MILTTSHPATTRRRQITRSNTSLRKITLRKIIQQRTLKKRMTTLKLQRLVELIQRSGMLKFQIVLPSKK